MRYQFAVARPAISGRWTDHCGAIIAAEREIQGFQCTGQRYKLQAGSIGFRPWAKLYDEQRKLVGTGLPAGCQRT